MTTKTVLAIDLGTSGPKVALVTTHGRLLGHEFEPNEVLLLPNGGAEQDPAEWWSSIGRAVTRLLARQLVPVDEIVAISCTSQWSGTVAIGSDGEHLMNAIIWMDTRGQPYVEKMVKGLVNIAGYGLGSLWEWVRPTGGLPGMAGKDPIAHILWLQHERPDIYEATATFLEPKDYLNLRLTGQRRATTDSIVLHWVTDNRDLGAIHYSDRLLSLAGLDGDKLPPLMPAADVIGPILPEVAREWGLPEGVPVIGGTPDVHSAAIGSGAVEDYLGNLYVGTSSWLVCHVPFKKLDVVHAMASLPSPVPKSYLLTNEQESAGACLTFLRDKLLFPKDQLTPEGAPSGVYQLFDELAAQAPAGSHGLIFTPWLYGERTPVEDHTIRAGFHNMSLTTDRSDLVRSVLEGVAFNSRWLLEAVEQFGKQPLSAIHFTGGGAQSPLWCQIFADVFGKPIRQVADPIHANLMGAAFLASVGLGYIEWSQIPGLVEIQGEYEPNPAHRGVYDAQFAEFKQLYKKNKGIYARLNRK